MSLQEFPQRVPKYFENLDIATVNQARYLERIVDSDLSKVSQDREAIIVATGINVLLLVAEIVFRDAEFLIPMIPATAVALITLSSQIADSHKLADDQEILHATLREGEQKFLSLPAEKQKELLDRDDEMVTGFTLERFYRDRPEVKKGAVEKTLADLQLGPEALSTPETTLRRSRLAEPITLYDIWVTKFVLVSRLQEKLKGVQDPRERHELETGISFIFGDLMKPEFELLKQANLLPPPNLNL